MCRFREIEQRRRLLFQRSRYAGLSLLRGCVCLDCVTDLGDRIRLGHEDFFFLFYSFPLNEIWTRTGSCVRRSMMRVWRAAHVVDFMEYMVFEQNSKTERFSSWS